MKKIMKYIAFVCVSAAFTLTACDDWTDTASRMTSLDDIGDPMSKSEEYYADLRTWKATAKERPISFGWFGGWTGIGASLSSCLIGLPDSMDMVSIWGEWKVLNEAKKLDLKRAQETKGLKVLACSFTENVGDNMTPSGEDVKTYWGWDASASGLNDEPTAEQEAAIRKYAKAFADLVNELGYDGFDIDHEPNFGGKGDLASSRPRLRVFVDELGKYFGPKSGTGKILVVDGEPQSMHPESGPYFDWFIVQAYDCKSYTNLNGRLATTIANYDGVLTPEEVANKYVVTENFEKSLYNTTGGADFKQEDGTTVKSYAGMAGWEPSYGEERFRKGGCGVYHIEYEHSVAGKSGFYPFTREAIRIMNPR